ncbi:MAG: GGDEF domain-containing protein [Pseudomonadota bacterium]
MSKLVDHLADLTGFRDRDQLDVTLVGAMKDLLKPQMVVIYRRVGEAGSEHWLTRARLTATTLVATFDPVWAELSSLPALDDHPHRLQCMESQSAIEIAGQPHITIFPVATERDVVGVMEVETEQPLSSESKRLVGSILRIYRNFQGLLDYSERDTLTGLLNRKTFDEAFLKASAEQQLVANEGKGDRRSVAGGPASSWLGVIDIDHFKRVNDTYGHLIGDEVLLLLSRLMRASFRFHDRLYRFGGEEFVVLMRCDNETDAGVAFERFRNHTENYSFPQVGRITVSIGFTALRVGDTPSGAFERADKAVYYVKEHGRNRVCSYTELTAKGELTEDDDKTGDVELF